MTPCFSRWFDTKRLDSSTKLRNSSLLMVLLSEEDCSPEIFIRPDTKLLINHSKGFSKKLNGRMNQPTREAIFSGKAAPMTFGVISLKIIISKATTKVAIESTSPLSPKMCRAIPVTRIGRMVLMRLLEIKSTDKSESMRFSRRSARAAPLLPLVAMARRRWRFDESMLVSAIEKKPERASKKTTRAI